MIQFGLSKEAFGSYVEQGYNIVPVWSTMPADLETPLSVYLKMKGFGKSCLLESVDLHHEGARFSFIGLANDFCLRLDDIDPKREGVFASLDKLSEQDRPAVIKDLPHLWGGYLGYVGYDAVGEVEPVSFRLPSPDSLPLALFINCQHSIVFDHEQQLLFVVAAVRVSDQEGADEAYDRGCRALEAMVSKLRAPLDTSLFAGLSEGEKKREALQWEWKREDFEQAVSQVQEYIRQGEVYQLVLSQRASKETSVDSVTLYRSLRMKNPSPYMFLMELGELDLIGSSPEMLVRLSQGTAFSKPIAGTRPRGENFEQDKELAQDLLADPKEQAEHVMLLDLARNDLGRVCDYGSVEVESYKEVEHFPRVMHMVSSVKGCLANGYKAGSLFQACFPAGTVSGAPKVRAMQLIDKLEPSRRGIYAGSLAYLGYQGTLDTCLILRSLVKHGNKVMLQAGAGIVADSIPSKEYDETLHKLKAVLEAIELAEEGGVLWSS